MSAELQGRFEQLRAEARDGIIVSDSMIDHFVQVVPVLQAVGARRTGAEPMLHSDGRLCMVDTYRLKDGSRLRAGYAIRAAGPEGAPSSD